MMSVKQSSRLFQKILSELSISQRWHSTIPLTKNMRIITATKSLTVVQEKPTQPIPGFTTAASMLKVKAEKGSLEEKKLVILLNWMMAPPKHVQKHADFYMSHGFDVLNVKLTPWQLLWPINGSQLVVHEMLQFLAANPTYQPSVVHGFSVAGYFWGEVLLRIGQDPDNLRPLISSLKAQIWDSAVDFEGIPSGFPRAVFPRNTFLRKSFEKYINYHMHVFHQKATTHYLQSSASFHRGMPVPALLLFSEADPIGSEKGNQRLKQSWDDNGVEVYTKCWKSSPHVSHFYHHPEEYRSAVVDFLSRLGLLESRGKEQMSM